MINQPTPQVSEADVTRVARRDFGDAMLPEVLSILSRYGAEQGPERPRVRLGILKLAAGDFSRLSEGVALACSDYRDVIMGAEMPNYLYHVKDEIRVQKVIDEDWKNYCAWLGKEGPIHPPQTTQASSPRV